MTVVKVLFILAIWVATVLLETKFLPSRKLGFTCQDPHLYEIFTGDTIELKKLLWISLLAPVIVFVFIFNFNFKQIWTLYREYLLGGSVAALVVEVVKMFVSEHRPHFFDVCRPDANEICRKGSFVEIYSCTNPNNYSEKRVRDSSRSFPSGHTALCVYTAIYCSYVIYYRHRYSVANYTSASWKALLIYVICIAWGILCSASRIYDKRHHWWDVLAGAVVAVFAAWVAIKSLSRCSKTNEGRGSFFGVEINNLERKVR